MGVEKLKTSKDTKKGKIIQKNGSFYLVNFKTSLKANSLDSTPLAFTIIPPLP